MDSKTDMALVPILSLAEGKLALAAIHSEARAGKLLAIPRGSSFTQQHPLPASSLCWQKGNKSSSPAFCPFL